MSPSEVIYRPYQLGDERAINDTFNQVFGTQRPLEEWLWKFPSRPGGRSIMLAFAGEELLTHYAGLPVVFQLDGLVFEAAQIVDVFSTRAARRRFARKGIWVQTAERFFARFAESGRHPVCFGFPGRRALRLGVLQLSYDEMEFQRIVQLVREPGGGRGRGRRLPYRAQPARDWEPLLDRLWERVRGDYPVAAVRDARWALGRLAGRPGVRYQRFMILPRFSEEPVGFVAFRCDAMACRWVDLLWDHDHPGVVETAAHLSRVLAAIHGAPREELWLNGDLAGQSVLERIGFVREPHPDGLVFGGRSFDPKIDLQAMEGRVYLTMADADLV
ncbi:MAG: GNAT family N-acetyltransferase [Acidobacteria bacterium]|nr:GNAT family N-acetyltransferase [Acidobacteriota bacterium]